MVRFRQGFLALLALLALGGCATLPSGPSVLVLPAPGKPFEVFQYEDATCRQWAGLQIGMSPQDVMNQNTAAGATVGTVIGAGLGAAIGAASGNAGLGAAIGAGSGLLFGTTSGASAGQVYGQEAQRRYDHAYLQCMYANGNQIPGTTRRTPRVRRNPPPPPPPSNYDATPQSAPQVYPPPPSSFPSR